jgi:hypothetical protein
VMNQPIPVCPTAAFDGGAKKNVGTLSGVSCAEAEKRKREGGLTGALMRRMGGGVGRGARAGGLASGGDPRRAQGGEKRGGPVWGGDRVVRAFWFVDIFLIILFIYFKFWKLDVANRC